MYSNRVLYVTLQPKRWNFPISRVVYRGYNNANANGGVSYANADFDSASVYAHLGSRLALKTEELAEYAGKQFTKLYAEYLLKA